jgi:benzoyl-CoA reductase/2-hydroxyglutaryl-CoA dehydratase subunit BcrC/BadD/HgdB
LKDLKHLIYFENLLEDANNELVRQAQENGSIVLGYTCYHIPEVLLNVDNCISVRLRAPKTGSLDISTYYMSNYACDYARALVERAIEGGYQFLDAMIGVDACSAMNRSMEHFEVLKVNSKEKFFVTHTDMPLKVTDYYIDSYTTQMREHVLNRLTETFGVDTSDEALRKAVAEHNEVCKIISEIAEMRKLDNPIITGYEFHILNLVSYTCPKALILPYLRETLQELRTREPDPKPWYRARVLIAGSEIDDPEFTKMCEMAGGLVVADRYCFGSMPGREEIPLEEGKDILQSIADYYMWRNQCPRAMGPENIIARKKYIFDLVEKYHADGIIVENMKFCEYWGYERAQDGMWFYEGYELPRSIPVCQIEKDYTSAASGQLRTRFQAFIESLEIKKIQAQQ